MTEAAALACRAKDPPAQVRTKVRDQTLANSMMEHATNSDYELLDLTALSLAPLAPFQRKKVSRLPS